MKFTLANSFHRQFSGRDRTRFLVEIAAAFCAGILMGLTTAPVEAPFFGWIALIPLWILVRKNPFPVSLLLGFVWGCGYHGIALFWITGVHPMTWMGVPWLASLLIALFCWFAITFWGAILVVCWATGMTFLKVKFNKQKINKDYYKSNFNTFLWVLTGVALWCGLEFLWSKMPLWWTSLSFTQSPRNLAILQLSQISGPSTITAILVAINGLAAEIIIRVNQELKSNQNLFLRFFSFLPYLRIVIFFVLILHSIGLWMYERPVGRENQNLIKIGIIQGNIPNEIKLYPAGWRKAIEGYTTGYKTLSDRGVDAVLTPEGALPFFQRDLIASSFLSAVREKGILAWLGAFGEGNSGYYFNSLFTISGTGDILSRYDKVNLVPIGEYVPFARFLGGIVRRLSPLEAHQISGSPNQIIDTPFGHAIVGICYDSVFSEHFRRQAAAGGDFIISASNNAHYSETMPAQHHAQDVMRAIETDRWAARATNTGYSGIVDPRGRTLWISEINTYQLHADRIYRRQTRTLYVRWGDWLTPVLLGLTLILWLLTLRR